ncbi:MAG: ubiquinone biosynthesis protein UbiH [Candidimonas sp.]|nr:MAG: ubiquinone biosynthesis protein UbiH [Candidimonas sp.]TAM22481.1 MAG: ubiquinone biosynthesis protein UbiH [Candidimonas sp.]TAM77985.1 MAG: ubiquinone biosynthesis protein UbiH [Candidimonas sp.]
MNKESVVVCGAGIVGLSCALGLARGGFSVTLIGPRPTSPQPEVGVYCPRVYAISSASQQFLADLGIWSLLDSARLTPVECMEIYGDANGCVTLQAWQDARTTLAWIMEASELERVLQQAVQVYGIHWQSESFRERQATAVTTESGRRFAANLLVGADGASSPVRHAAGIAARSRPYGDTGLVVHLTSDLPHQQTAMQWFTTDGVLALLPMPDTADGHQVSMVWSMPQSLAKTLQDLPEPQRNADLQARLQAVTGGRLGSLRVRSPLLGFPLFLEHSDMVAPGVALVGDAAHRIHPLAGQGLNLGLADVQELLRVLGEKEAYRSVADYRVLQRYRRARAEPVLAMRLATDGLHRLFAAQSAPIAWARNAGMQCVDRLPFIKRFLIAGASGQ